MALKALKLEVTVISNSVSRTTFKQIPNHKILDTTANLSPCRPETDHRPVHVGLAVDNVQLAQVFVRVIRFSPVSINPPMLHTSISFIYNRSYVILSSFNKTHSLDTTDHNLKTSY